MSNKKDSLCPQGVETSVKDNHLTISYIIHVFVYNFININLPEIGIYYIMLRICTSTKILQ